MKPVSLVVGLIDEIRRRIGKLVQVLDALEDSDDLSVTQIGEALSVDQPRASRLVARAVENAYVRRVAHPLDGRRQQIQLTAKGRHILDKVQRHRREAVAAALNDFSETEAQALARLLTRFIDSWSDPR